MSTMADVARRANVALSTVSYAINGTRPISEETRQRIFAAMEELGYKPNALARGLASKRSRIIALLFPTPERGLGITELEFVTAATDTAKENDYNLILWTSDRKDLDGLRDLTQQGLVDGVVVMEVHLDEQRIDVLREADFPYSLIGRRADTAGISYVDIDFDQTVKESITYLRGLGHSRIAFLNHSQTEYDAGYGPSVRAQAAYEEAAREAGMRNLSRMSRATPTGGYEALGDLLETESNLTALITMNERAIPGIMQGVAERGWSIPDDFSLVAVVSSARAAEMVIPSLTTMEPPSARMARLGVELLIRKLEGAQEVPQILLPCRLVIRGSTSPCRRNIETAGENL
jgi:DNA-binding LacI/PurR family transcriptional regulator